MPTPMDFTAAYIEAVAFADASATHYDTLTFSNPGGTLRVVHSHENLITPQGTYIACQFDFQPPETEGEIVGKMKITVQFLPRSARVWLDEQSRTGAQLSIVWRQYLGAGIDPDFESRVSFYVETIERTVTGATITATLPDLANTPFCKQLMTRYILPGMAA